MRTAHSEIHGNNERSCNAAQALELRRHIRILHSKKNEALAIDRPLLFITNLEHYLSTTHANHMQNWLNTYKQAILDSIATAQTESVRGTRPLETYFISIPSQIPKRPPCLRFNHRLHTRKDSSAWKRRRRQPLPAYGRIASYFTSIATKQTSPP